MTEAAAPREIFHVHTRRCRHAGDEDDRAYVERALALGAGRITFTDHAPFPGDPFGNRMRYAELPEYLDSMARLREEYRGRIEVRAGLEIEYLPSFRDYYCELSGAPGLEMLLLGQHFFEREAGRYSFSDPAELLRKAEPAGLCEAMCQGMETGIFPIVAHPDRMFRKAGVWSAELEALAQRLILVAKAKDVILERNASSMRKGLYREEFWALAAGKVRTIDGADAHCTAELG